MEDYNSLNYAQFERIYGPDKDKWSIYKLSFTSDEEQVQPEDEIDPVGGTENYQEIPQPAPSYGEYIN
jgi:hypothetical protein